MAIYVKKVPGRTVISEDREYLYFGGTSYLGLQNHAGFEALFVNNVLKHGTSHGASRQSNLRLNIYAEAEAYMARWANAEAAMLLSSGYLAGQLLRDFFDDPAFLVFHMPGTHSALTRKGDSAYSNLKDLKQAIEGKIGQNASKTAVLFLDSVGFSEENYPDFKFLKSLPLDRMILIADDSHGLGILGENGSGAFPILKKLGAKEQLVCGSLSKGPTVQAGIILGEKKRLKQLRNSPFYAGSSPASPASMATLIKAETIYKEQRQKLKKNIELFTNSVKKLSFFQQTSSHPAFNYNCPKLTDFLMENNILVTHFSYPDAQAAVLSRIVISAGHTSEDIKKLSSLINEFLAENG